MNAAIDNVIAIRGAAGDTKIEYVEFPTQNCQADGSGCGCDYHPNAAEQQAMATILEGGHPRHARMVSRGERPSTLDWPLV